MQKQRVKTSVRASIKDGVAWATMSGFSDPYAVPFAMALGASTMGVGVLRSVPFAGFLFLSVLQRAAGARPWQLQKSHTAERLHTSPFTFCRGRCRPSSVPCGFS